MSSSRDNVREMLQARAEKPGLAGVLQQAAELIVSSMVAEIRDDIANLDSFSRQAMQDIAEGVATDFGSMQELMQKAVEAIVQGIREADSTEDLKQAIGSIKFPNHAHQLNRIEQALKAGKVDLKPVINRLDQLREDLPAPAEMPEPAREWTFEVTRDPETRLIQSVHAIGD